VSIRFFHASSFITGVYIAPYRPNVKAIKNISGHTETG